MTVIALRHRENIQPFSVVATFRTQQFLFHWVISGATSLVYKYCQECDVTVALEEVAKGTSFINIHDVMSIDLSSIANRTVDPTALLLQSGYLTIKDKRNDGPMMTAYSVVIPNLEVEKAVASLFFKASLNMQDAEIDALHMTLTRSRFT